MRHTKWAEWCSQYLREKGCNLEDSGYAWKVGTQGSNEV